MNSKSVVLLSTLLLSSPVFAFQCYLTLAKDSCWINYDVKLTVTDVNSKKLLTTVTVAKGNSWTRQAFDCVPGQKLLYQATFEPSFWQADKEQIYTAHHFWTLPSDPKKAVAWEIPVCYPSAFAGIPFPPDAIGNCQCNFNKIPPLKRK